jgi:N4-gp56 family major capsid protein
MALTNIATTTARTGVPVQQWSNKVLFWAYKKMFLSRLIGTVVREQNELKKEKGDVVTITTVAPLVGTGKTDHQQRGDGGEALVSFTDTVTLHANKHECGSDGPLSEQRTILDLRNLAKDGLSEWLAQLMDDKAVNVLSGVATADALCAANAPSTYRYFCGGQIVAGTITNRTAVSSLTAAELMGPELISMIKRKAEVPVSQTMPKIRPIMWEGKKLYVCIMHPYQMRDFRKCTSFLSKAYYVDAKEWKNPLTNGAEFIWDDVICYSWEKILTRLGAGGSTLGTEAFDSGVGVTNGVYGGRALFLGADALGLAFGKDKARWSEYDFPHGDGWSAGVETINGFKKIEFNSEDFGVIAVDTACTPDS